MRPIVLALLLIAGNLPASAQVIDQGIRQKCTPANTYGWNCVVPKSLRPLRYEKPPDWKHPPVHCYGQPWDIPECRGKFG